MKRDQINSAHAQDLYAAILQLESLAEVESFFHDLCTLCFPFTGRLHTGYTE